ncbi:pentraxin-related protein PTX3-like [Rhinatrema bivittatum]|uniref:pentraxin-related protein PTX3-like n=1 Tax=Rhinatrema bivittatum TaxID=194408 RepID=UPI00112C773A|nr:pentraxin-related protein PTX3-like [Rhinatrema bivittatum]
MALPLDSWWWASALYLGLSAVASYPYQREDSFLLYPDPLDDSEDAARPCQDRDQDQALRWDKLFIAMENAEMKQNIMLHALNDVLAPDVRALHAEVRNTLRATANASAAPKVVAERQQEELATAHLLMRLEEAGQKQLGQVHLLLEGVMERLEALEDILRQQSPPKPNPEDPRDPVELPGREEATPSAGIENAILTNELEFSQGGASPFL